MTTQSAKRILAYIGSIFLGVMLLAGCGSANSSGTNGPVCTGPSFSERALVLVVSVHQGGSAPSVPAAAGCDIDRALKSARPISVVTVEGTPKVLLKSATWKLNDGLPEKDNPQAYADDLGGARAAVIDTVRTATARSDHADLLAALGIAADQGRQTGDSVRILLVDNGLSDSGAVDIAAPGMSTAKPSDVGAFVASRGSCPASLRGTSMTMYGAGYGVAPQDALSIQQMNNVGRIWQAVTAACGGRLALVPTPRTDVGPDTPFRVEPVTPQPAPTMAALPAGQTLEFTGESALTFSEDGAELRDSGAAHAALVELARYLTRDSGRAVTISGTTSNGPTAWPSHIDLAGARAETVKALLIEEFGVLPQQIRCKGLGYVADPPVVDPATAALNRTTKIHVDS